jgi:hypothetical protein
VKLPTDELTDENCEEEADRFWPVALFNAATFAQFPAIAEFCRDFHRRQYGIMTTKGCLLLLEGRNHAISAETGRKRGTELH